MVVAMRIAVVAVSAAASGEVEGVSSTGGTAGRGLATGTAVVTFTFDDGFESQLLVPPEHGLITEGSQKLGRSQAKLRAVVSGAPLRHAE